MTAEREDKLVDLKSLKRTLRAKHKAAVVERRAELAQAAEAAEQKRQEDIAAANGCLRMLEHKIYLAVVSDKNSADVHSIEKDDIKRPSCSCFTFSNECRPEWLTGASKILWDALDEMGLEPLLGQSNICSSGHTITINVNAKSLRR